jgi:hypothetical protein
MTAGRDPGPLVRPYALTGGRTRPSSDLPIETLVAAVGPGDDQPWERRALLSLCRRPVSVVELAARLPVPLGVARVLVADLAADGLVEVHRPPEQVGGPDVVLLRRVLDGIRAL